MHASIRDCTLRKLIRTPSGVLEVDESIGKSRSLPPMPTASQRCSIAVVSAYTVALATICAGSRFPVSTTSIPDTVPCQTPTDTRVPQSERCADLPAPPVM